MPSAPSTQGSTSSPASQVVASAAFRARHRLVRATRLDYMSQPGSELRDLVKALDRLSLAVESHGQGVGGWSLGSSGAWKPIVKAETYLAN